MNKNKRLYTVAEILSLTGTTRKTLYYYDKIGLLIPTDRIGPQAHKLYDEDALEHLKMILRYRKAGLKINEIKLVISSSVPERRNIYEKVLDRLMKEKEEKENTIINLMAIMEEELS